MPSQIYVCPITTNYRPPDCRPLEYVQRAARNQPIMLAMSLARLQERWRVALEAAAAVPRWRGHMDDPSHGMLTAVLGSSTANHRRLQYFLETG